MLEAAFMLAGMGDDMASFLEEHFDTEVTIVIAILGSFWGLIRHSDSKEKEHSKDQLQRIEKDLKDVSTDIKLISANLITFDDIKKLDDDISEVQKELNLMRERMVSHERMKELDGQFSSIRGIIQKTREQMIQLAIKEKANAEKVSEAMQRIEKAVESKADKNNCSMIHASTIKQAFKGKGDD